MVDEAYIPYRSLVDEIAVESWEYRSSPEGKRYVVYRIDLRNDDMVWHAYRRFSDFSNFDYLV